MLETLRQLKHVRGVNVAETVRNLLDIDHFDREDDRRLCIAMAICGTDPDAVEHGERRSNVIIADGVRYFVTCDDSGANQACHELIADTAASLDVDFLSQKTGFHFGVFEALAHGGRDASKAVLNLIAYSCGMKEFVKDILDIKGMGHFLGEETILTFGDNRTGRIFRRGARRGGEEVTRG